ncbi:DUF2188 domain-containing protein [Acholeplasma sp. OttesenSCG-928-E16]|nr:DUF2188 domain-containing protein [Acholeplasma sp. OttesenSCG-928-E16]
METNKTKYHVSQNKVTGTDKHRKWRVRKEGSDKTIKFFETKQEAVLFAKNLAAVNDSFVVIHGVKGKIMEYKDMEGKQKVEAKEPLKKSEKPKKTKYHISREMEVTNKNYKKWRIRKEGSEKTIKYFKTQKEAMEFANALNNETKAVAVHKKTGAIRKQIKSK